MAPYLSNTAMAARLAARYPRSFPTAPVIDGGDADIASDKLDASGPFLGEKYDPAQARQFPRTYLRDGDVPGAVPDGVLEWVALRAYRLSEDDEPAIASEGIGDIRVSYATPKLSQATERMTGLLRPYLRPASDSDVGSFSLDVASSFVPEARQLGA